MSLRIASPFGKLSQTHPLVSMGVGRISDMGGGANYINIGSEEVGSVVRSRGCSACCARRVYWNVNYFGVIRAIAMARAVVGHRERAVPVACWPSTIYSCSYELSIGLTTSLKTIDGDCW